MQRVRDGIRVKSWPLYVILLESVIGASAIIYATRWGPWAHSDSAAYILSARNLLGGLGLGQLRASGRFVIGGGHPPLYSLVLSLAGLGGMDLISAARWLDVVLFSATIFITGLALYTLTRSPWLSLLVSSLMLTSPVLLNHFSGAMSEPLFFSLGLASLFLILGFLQGGRRTLLVLAALAAGFAFLSRYAGFAFVLTGVVGVTFRRSESRRERLANFGIFAVISVLPMLGWLAYLSIQPDAGPPRQFALPAGNLWDGTQFLRGKLVETFWGWIPFSSLLPTLSYRSMLTILAVIAAAFATPFALAKFRSSKGEIRKTSPDSFLRIAGLFALFFLSYVLVLAFTVTFTQNPPDIDHRVISPLRLASLIAFFSVSYALIQFWPGRKLFQIFPVAAALLVVIPSISASINYLSDLHSNGSGYSSRRWQTSKMIVALREIPAEVPIITNESAAVALLAYRPAYDIPELMGGEPLMVFSAFGDDTEDETHRIFREEGAAFALFDTVIWQMQPMYGDDTGRRLEAFTMDLRLYSRPWDGAIYYYEPDGP